MSSRTFQAGKQISGHVNWWSNQLAPHEILMLTVEKHNLDMFVKLQVAKQPGSREGERIIPILAAGKARHGNRAEDIGPVM